MNLGQHVRITKVFSELKMIKRIWLLRGDEMVDVVTMREAMSGNVGMPRPPQETPD
jgi:hypothetical protein